MKRIGDAFQKYKIVLSSNQGQIFFLLFISLLTHGLFIPWLGIYGDDWGLLWLSYRAGSTDMFFLENRFLFPYIYSLFSFFLNPNIREWHILFFLIRFFSVVNLWILLKKALAKQKAGLDLDQPVIFSLPRVFDYLPTNHILDSIFAVQYSVHFILDNAGSG